MGKKSWKKVVWIFLFVGQKKSERKQMVTDIPKSRWDCCLASKEEEEKKKNVELLLSSDLTWCSLCIL